MEKVELGKSGLKVTPIAFGAWAIGGWMWGGADRNDALDALNRSIDLGITTIDTAAVYGMGKSEELVGEAVKGKRDRVEILTKYGLNWQNKKGRFHFTSMGEDGKPLDIYKYASKDSVIAECDESLRRLKTDYIDLYQIHWPDPTTPIDETMEAIEKLMTQGKIRAAGVSNFSKDETSEAFEISGICSNQVPYSMVNRGIEKDLVPYCMDNNISILAYSPLQRGLLTGKIKPDYRFRPGDHRPENPYFTLGNLIKINDFLQKIKPVADEKGYSLAQLVIQWTIQQKGITVVLVGARNRKQVDDNYISAGSGLSDEELTIIDNHLEDLDLSL